MKNKKTLKTIGIILAILGIVCTLFFVINCITIATGQWTPLNDAGKEVGITPSVIYAVISGVVALVGAFLWKKSKSQ